MKTLLEDYQHKLTAIKELIITNTNNGSINDISRKTRLETTANEYRAFIVDINRMIARQEELKSDNSELINTIFDIIHSEVTLREVPYSMSDNEMEINPDSITDAAIKIAEILK